MSDLELLATETIRSAGLDPTMPPSPVALADALLGPGHVRLARIGDQPPRLARLVRLDSASYILVRRGLKRPSLRWAIFHELGHWLAEREGMLSDERTADTLGALLRAPQLAVERAVDEDGASWRPLAQRFTTSQASAALRFAEVTSEPLALISRRSVRLRGREYAWPVELRGLVKAAPPAGITCTQLEDDRSRWVLHVAG